MSKIELPEHHKPLLEDLARQHKFSSGQAFAAHLLERGLRQYPPVVGESLDEKLAGFAEAEGYSSKGELVEHLLERGLRAYQTPESDPEKLEARLRGLGYID